MLVVTVGWAFFRADTVEQALRHVRAMAGFGSGDGVAYHVWLYLHQDVALALIVGAIGATPFLAHLGQHILATAGRLHEGARTKLPPLAGWCAVGGLYAVLLLSAISIAAGNYNPFIYFRF
jgi:alginate O-acetyltransferase complex protein AlgI